MLKKWWVAALALVVLDVAWNGLAIVGRVEAAAQMPWPAVAGVIVAVTAIGLAIDARRWRRWSSWMRGKESNIPYTPRLPMWLSLNTWKLATPVAVVAGVALSVPVGMSQVPETHYQRADSVTNFHTRAPMAVADSHARGNQGDDEGSVGSVRYLADDDGLSRYSAVVTGTIGYSSIREYTLDIDGNPHQSHSCQVPDSMSKSWGAVRPWRSLKRELTFHDPLLHFNSDDMYGYCDGGPVVVMPLWRYVGFTGHKEAAGVAVYTPDGLRVTTEGIEGPVFPKSLVPNADTLEAVEGGLHYVSALGDDRLNGLLVVDARTGESRVENLDLPSRASIVQSIRSVSAADMTIYEIVPADGQWVASMGLGQTVEYRAIIAQDGSVSVTSAEGAVTEDPLVDMTDEELLALMERIIAEMKNRN